MKRFRKQSETTTSNNSIHIRIWNIYHPKTLEILENSSIQMVIISFSTIHPKDALNSILYFSGGWSRINRYSTSKAPTLHQVQELSGIGFSVNEDLDFSFLQSNVWINSTELFSRWHTLCKYCFLRVEIPPNTNFPGNRIHISVGWNGA